MTICVQKKQQHNNTWKGLINTSIFGLKYYNFKNLVHRNYFWGGLRNLLSLYMLLYSFLTSYNIYVLIIKTKNFRVLKLSDPKQYGGMTIWEVQYLSLDALLHVFRCSKTLFFLVLNCAHSWKLFIFKTRPSTLTWPTVGLKRLYINTLLK